MNYALIGCGRISTNHIKAALNNNLNIVAVCDIVESQMEDEGLKNVVITPIVPTKFYSSWAQYTIVVEKREELAKYLKENGIPTKVYYGIPMHKQKAFDGVKTKYIDMLNNEFLHNRDISLPIGPYITKEDQDKVINCIKKFYGK